MPRGAGQGRGQGSGGRATNDVVLAGLVLDAIATSISFFDGVLWAQWIELPFASPSEPDRKIHLRVSAELDALLRTSKGQTFTVPCLGNFDVSDFRPPTDFDVFVSYEWSRVVQVDGLQQTRGPAAPSLLA